MPNIPIDIPPGMYLNGTEYAAQGRWRNGNLVRFFRGLPQPVGGWTGVPINLTVTLPRYMEYDGNDVYYDLSYTATGNKVTTVLRFNTDAFTGGNERNLIEIQDLAGYARTTIEMFASDDSNPVLRNKIRVIVEETGGSINCMLGTATGYADGKDHMLFFSFDGDNGLATFFIDGKNADDPDFEDRIAPTTTTLGTGASSDIIVGGGSTTPGSTYWVGKIGPFGHDDQYLTNWADFMEGNLPKEIDETNWTEWGGTQPLYWSLEGDMASNDGSEANMTVVGSPTLVDSEEGFTDFLPGYCRSMLSWRDSDGQRWLAIGTTRNLFAFDGSTLYDITPPNIGVGEQGWTLGPGYGSGLYGTESYGTQRTQVIGSIVTEPGSWSLDNWGENLVAVANWNGQVFEWDPNAPSTVAALVTGDTGTGSAEAPEQNRALVVSNERHLVLIGAGDYGGVLWTQNPRKIWWSDSEDNTTWVAAATNSAGDLELQTNGVAQCATRFYNEIIIWTNVDVHRMSYIGPPYFYGIKSVGAKAGIIGQQAYTVTDNFIFWVGPEGFHIYDGSVRELQPEVWDHYIDNLNKSQQAQVVVGHNPRFNEIWIFYPADDAIVNDSYIIWNYQENHWSVGTLSRSAWHEALIWDNPIGARPYGNTTQAVTHTQNWTHDTDYDIVSQFEPLGVDYQIQLGSFEFQDQDGATYGTENTDYRVEYVTGQVRTLSTGSFANGENITASFTIEELSTPRSVLFFHEDGYGDEFPQNPVRDAWVETAPFEIGAGDNVAFVRRFIQDTGREDDLDPTLNSNVLEYEFDVRLAPEADAATFGPYTVDTNRGYTDVRFTGRQVVMRLRQTKNELWRGGRNRLDVIESSGR